MGTAAILKDDARDILVGLRLTIDAGTTHGAFSDGFRAALEVVAACLGVDPIAGDGGRRWVKPQHAGGLCERWEVSCWPPLIDQE
jgi:hypothetical protein